MHYIDVRYVDNMGREVFVAAGIGGVTFGTFCRRPSGAIKRVRSSKLPMRQNRSEAEADLIRHATKKGWRRV